MMQTNKYQTQITDELLSVYPQEVQDQFYDFINNVPIIQNLISPNREYAKDRPRDEEGKIIIDLANPHIIEDSDYFRPSAIHFQKHGCYTKLKPNSNPNSEFHKWLTEEIRRCWQGYIRESDGEWVTGYLYYYLNYSPIMLSKIKEGTKQADRVYDFPEFWEGVYWRYHYLHQGYYGGLYNDFKGGNHSAELASRGKAFAYSQMVETPEGLKKWEDITVGDYLFSIDGSTTKVIDIPFDEECEVYKMCLHDGREVLTTKEHLWKMYKNGAMWDVLYTTEQIRTHKRMNRFAIPKIQSVDYDYQNVEIDPYLLGLVLGDGSLTISKYNQAQFSANREDAVEYEKLLGIKFQSVKNHQTNWLIPCKDFGKKIKSLGLSECVSHTKFIPKSYLYNTKEVRYKILKGLLDTDGSVHDSGKPEFYTTSLQLAKDVIWLCRSLGYIASMWVKKSGYKKEGVYKQCKDCYIVYIQTNDLLFGLSRKNAKCGNLSKSNLKRTLSSNVKSIEFSHIEKCKCVTVDREDGMFLIGDFMPTHNSKSYSLSSILSHNFVLGVNENAKEKTNSIVTAYQKEYLTKDGVLNKFVTNIDFLAENTQFPRKRLQSSYQHMSWKMGYKDAELDIEKGTRNSVLGVSSKDDESKLRGKRAAFIGIEEFGTFARLIDTYNVLIPSVQEGDYLFGFMYLTGTAGDNESDFAGAQEIMYSPRGYNMYPLPNVFDKINGGKSEFVFFFGGYVNRKGCYNKDGVSDVIKALLEILNNRYRVKYHSSDPNTIIKTIAEIPITPAEAIVKVGNNIFPITELNNRLTQLDTDSKILNDVYVGDLVLNSNGKIEYTPSSNSPIRSFPYKETLLNGAIEFYQLPEKNSESKVHANRYIAGVDPYDSDTLQGEGMSLGSIFVLDLWTDKIVCEYTGRPNMVDDFFEICRKICLFYNAKLNYENNKKGLFAYFSQKNCLHLLTDVLEFLRDKQLLKSSGFGNTSKGTVATLAINNYAKTLIRNWLLGGDNIIESADTEEITYMPNLYFIKSRALLQELIGYNTIANFDRISALGMLMLLREDKMILYGGNLKGSSNTNNSDYLGNDPFFTKNYDTKFGKMKQPTFE